MRKVQGDSGVAVLEREDEAVSRADAAGGFRRPASDVAQPSRRGPLPDLIDDEDTAAFLRRNRRIRRGLIPRTRNGWIVAGVVAALALGFIGVSLFAGIRFLRTAEIFRIPSSQSIELVGNSHLSRAQMLSVFGEDVDRNIFLSPLEERQQQLQMMPWVERATIMRLLPNRLRIAVRERTPVAYLRQGGKIGLVDAHGVALDIPPDMPGNPSYSFPVVTGLKPGDSAAERETRMQLYSAFLQDLDSDGKGTSSQLSEVDLSDPEDVRALIPNGGSEVLVHFGTEKFLARYQQFEEHVAEWRSTYPRLSSVDMRYQRQVVLQMPPKDSTVTAAPAATAVAEAKPTQLAKSPAVKTAAVPVKASPAVAATKPAASAAERNTSTTTVLPAAAKSTVSTARPVVIAGPATASQPLPLKAAPSAQAVVLHGATASSAVPPAPGGKAAATALAHPPVAKPVGKVTPRDAATRKRVDAIKAWMARREKLRATASTKGASPAGN